MSAALAHPVDGLVDDPWYGRLKDYLIGATGMAYYAKKDADLARRLRRRLSERSLRDCAAYLEYLRDPLRGPAEMEALIAEVTIGETYFFRHREHYDALRDVVLPDLMVRNRDTSRLRFWCAGCADGAEPYTLSMILHRPPSPLPAGWQTSILGTDLNRRFLAAARLGRFDEWSLRATPADVRLECFGATGKQWTISPEYRDGVSIAYHNLAEGDFPPPGDHAAFDLIICRNVMIYFSAELMQKVVERFHDCLTPGGWLLVGPSEPNMTHFTSFRAVNAPGVTLYQKPTEAVERPSFVPGLPALPVLPPLPPAPAVQVPEPPLPGNLDPMTHFRHALAMEESGEYAEAERSLRRVIYLDRKAPLAHYHLGLLLGARGDSRQAGRYFGNALKALQSQPRNAVLHGADGLTAGALMEMIRAAEVKRAS